LVLANRDGRGIKVEDNVKTTKPVADNHSLVTQGANLEDKFKKGVDLNLADTWTKAAGTEGSILVKENSFADVKNAHGTQDALIYADGKQKTIDATAPLGELRTFQDTRKDALATLKEELANAIDTNILKAKAGATAAADKAKLDTEAQKALSSIEKATDYKAISDALTTLNNVAEWKDATFDGTTKDNGLKAIADAAQKYVTKLDTAVKESTERMKDLKVDVTTANSPGKLVNDELKKITDTTTNGSTALLAAGTEFNHTAQANRFAAIAKFATVDEAFKTATAANGALAALNGKEVDFSTIAADKIGALNLAINGTAGKDDPVAKDILDSFKKLRAQTTVDGANSAIDEINKKLDKIIANADGKTMDTKEAQQGMIAHSFKQFFTGVKAGMNEPDKAGMSSIVGLDTTNSTNMGRLSLVANNGRDIQVEVKDANGFTANSALGFDKNVSEATVSLRETNATISKE
ncbi:hypothetical protein AVANS14531_09035, partial [Campylobacter sp. Cr9]|uniref:hypothetical protein n=1 Tax=Campylobacter sp. Cr9 TaxID=2735728 RepID=UPI0030141E3E|nr:hypothetical protein [Campylobacter sp. Cr9]